MKVILLRDVPKVGRKYEVHDVADGFAINHLLPDKKAVFASPAAIAKSEADRARSKEADMAGETAIAEQFAALQDTAIEMQERANEQGHLFASIGEEEIANAIFEHKKIRLEPSMIDLDKPIKELGERDITLRHGEHEAVLRLVVVPE